jgi:HD-like signal output (HDOD) protein
MSEMIKDKILQSVEKMPSLPLTALKVLRLANNVNSPPQEMLETIKVDPVITAKVLKMINSSYFGLGSTVTDLRQALVMLGMNTIKNLALTSALLTTMKSKKCSTLDLDGLWLHSLATAVSSKIIAREAGLPRMSHDEFFIIGLLHNIGKIFIFQFLEDEYSDVLENAKTKGLSLSESENDILSMTSAEIGGLLAKKWQLPDNITSGILYNQTFSEAKDFSKTCAIIKIASYISTLKEIGWSDGLLLASPSEDAYTLAGVTLEDLEDPMVDLPEQIENAKSFIQE